MHTRHLAGAFALATLSTATFAQTYSYSPNACGLHEASSNNNFPFQGIFHYQQCHGDIKGAAQTIKGLAWRRDASTTTTQPARTQDIELFMGDGTFAALTSTFLTNYTNTPVNVFTKKSVALPDHTTRPDFQPAPWDINCLFDTPYVYTGVNDIVYEVVVHTNTVTGSYVCDAYSATTLQGGFSVNGTGCTTANGVMKLRTNVTSTTTTSLYTISWGVTGGPTSAASTLLVGLTNPNFPLFGLCSSVYTDGALFSVNGTTTSTGAITTIPSPALSIAYAPGLVGFPFTAQMASLDASQPGLQVAVSNGNQAVLPPLMPVPAVQIARIYASGAPTATAGTLSLTSGLATRFQN